MKKYIVIISVVTLLAVACYFLYKNYNKPVEEPVRSMGAIESAINNAMLSPNESEEAPKDEEEKTGTNDNIPSTEKPAKVSVIKKAVKKVQHKFVHENTPAAEEKHQKKEVVKSDINEGEQRKFTPEEEELLKKIPRTDEVVVDKEIKVKSSGKYLFK